MRMPDGSGCTSARVISPPSVWRNPDRIRDIHRLRDQPQRKGTIRGGLLARDNFIRERVNPEFRAVHRQGLRLNRHAHCLCHRGGYPVTVGIGPSRSLAQSRSRRGDHRSITRIGGEITVGEGVSVNLQNLRRPRQNRRMIFRFGNGKEQVPHRPSHDGIRRKSRRRIGRAEIDHLDIRQLQTIGLQR